MNGIELKRDQWHTRWFRWSAEVLDEFWPFIVSERPPRETEAYDGTNLCRYVRTLFLGGVVVPAMHIGLVLLWAGALFLYPVYVFGLYSWGVVAGSIVGGIALIVAAVTAVVFGWRLLKMVGTWSFGHVEHAVNALERRHQQRGPGLVSLLWQNIVAQHNKICLKVTFRNSNKEERHV